MGHSQLATPGRRYLRISAEREISQFGKLPIARLIIDKSEWLMGEKAFRD